MNSSLPGTIGCNIPAAFQALPVFAVHTLANQFQKVAQACLGFVVLYAIAASIPAEKRSYVFRDCSTAVQREFPLFVIATAHDAALACVIWYIATAKTEYYTWSCNWLVVLSIIWGICSVYSLNCFGTDLKAHKHIFKFTFSLCCFVLDYHALTSFKILYFALLPGIIRKVVWFLTASYWDKSLLTTILRDWIYGPSYIFCQILIPAAVLGGVSVSDEEAPLRRGLAFTLAICVLAQFFSETVIKTCKTHAGKHIKFMKSTKSGDALPFFAITNPQGSLLYDYARNPCSVEPQPC